MVMEEKAHHLIRIIDDLDLPQSLTENVLTDKDKAKILNEFLYKQIRGAEKKGEGDDKQIIMMKYLLYGLKVRHKVQVKANTIKLYKARLELGFLPCPHRNQTEFAEEYDKSGRPLNYDVGSIPPEEFLGEQEFEIEEGDIVFGSDISSDEEEEEEIQPPQRQVFINQMKGNRTLKGHLESFFRTTNELTPPNSN